MKSLSNHAILKPVDFLSLRESSGVLKTFTDLSESSATVSLLTKVLDNIDLVSDMTRQLNGKGQTELEIFMREVNKATARCLSRISTTDRMLMNYAVYLLVQSSGSYQWHAERQKDPRPSSWFVKYPIKVYNKYPWYNSYHEQSQRGCKVPPSRYGKEIDSSFQIQPHHRRVWVHQQSGLEPKSSINQRNTEPDAWDLNIFERNKTSSKVVSGQPAFLAGEYQFRLYCAPDANHDPFSRMW